MARPLSTDARDKMLAAAIEVILDRGWSGFTIDEVAQRSGVAKTTIYRHFPEPTELMLRAVDGTVAYAALPDTGSLRGDLAEFLRRILPNFTDQRSRAAHYELWAALMRDPELADRRQQVMEMPLSKVPELIDRWKEQGQISPKIDLVTAFEIINGPFTLRSLIAPHRLVNIDIDALVERMMLQLQA